MELFVDFAREFGPATALVAFFIMRDFMREKKQQETIEKLRDFQQGSLISMHAEMITAIQNTNVQLEKFSERLINVSQANQRE
jgi:hypothetical protein